MNTNINFGMLYTVGELALPWIQFLARRHCQHPLPTQVVITDPKFLVPQIARTYETGLYILGDHVVDYRVLHTAQGFHGTSAYPHVVFREVWENCGEDGHVDYSLQGWVFEIVSSEQLHKWYMGQGTYAQLNHEIQEERP